ncbi:murein hydrolase activator EnvC family protein [uncultured Sphingomonas sp.]|uniref:murein hydrolase activator EnvC family protein n=1 Tax=uncultured Sphingomonas sp. TaxID=158754 RepID=UPI0035C9F036
MKRILLLALAPFAAALAVGQGSAQLAVAEQQRRLVEARAQSAAAAARAAMLDAAAAGERDAAAKARAQEAAIAARVGQAEADIAAATARIALVDRLLADQRTRLAAEQGPIVRLIAALQSFALRPSVLGVLQPGSLDDLVHVRAVLASTLPVVAARTAGLRVRLDRTRRLRAGQAVAAAALAESRTRLETTRRAYSRMAAAHRLKSRDLGRDALVESDRAIGLGERARDLVDQMQTTQSAAGLGASLGRLPGPSPRPGDEVATALPWTIRTAPYRLPVAGRLVTGFGELSDSGVRSRGLSFAVTAAAPVIAPARGRIAFAGAFRGYGNVVIIDHGGGWTSLLSGLGALDVQVGRNIAQGDRVGAAPQVAQPVVTVELRRRDRAVDLVPLTG